MQQPQLTAPITQPFVHQLKGEISFIIGCHNFLKSHLIHFCCLQRSILVFQFRIAPRLPAKFSIPPRIANLFIEIQQ